MGLQATTVFATPTPTSPRNAPSLSGAYNVMAAYLDALRNLSGFQKHYDIFIESGGTVYDARFGDTGDVADTDTDFGALANRLFASGSTIVALRMLGTYNDATPILVPNGCALIGGGPGAVVKATGSWASGTVATPGSYMFDIFNGGAGRKWVSVVGVFWDCNSLAEGGIRYCGLVSDTTQWNYFALNFVANFRVVGIRIEDQSSAGGTRQHVESNKIGPGASGVPTRGIELRCNDIHLNENDVFSVSDVGIYVSKRGAAQDKGTGSWFINGGHVAIGNYQSGGLSPDNQPVNVLVDCTASSGEINRVYIDNTKRYGIYVRPVGGHVSTVVVRDCWFNGLTSLVDTAGSDKAVCLVLDQSLASDGAIYSIGFIGNRGNTAKTGTSPTAGVWYAMVALLGGMQPSNNYVMLDDNMLRGCLHFWDPNGARPGIITPANWIQPTGNNTSQGQYAANAGIWTTLENLLNNPGLGIDLNADNTPDGWTKQGTGTQSYVGGVWQIVVSNVNQLIYQNVPCVAGLHYSVSFDASVIAGAGAAKLAILFLDATGTQVGAGASTTGASGVGGFANLAVSNKLAPVDDGTSGGTVNTTAGTAAIVAATGTFPNDLVNDFTIPGAGVAGADLVTKIQTYTDSTHVTLLVAPSTSITGATWIASGHGDAVAFQVSLKGVTPTTTFQWKNGIVAQAANTTGQSGANTTWTIPHNLPQAPTTYQISPVNSVAAGSSAYVSAVDATNLTITTTSVTAPSWSWEAAV